MEVGGYDMQRDLQLLERFHVDSCEQIPQHSIGAEEAAPRPGGTSERKPLNQVAALAEDVLEPVPAGDRVPLDQLTDLRARKTGGV